MINVHVNLLSSPLPEAFDFLFKSNHLSEGEAASAKAALTGMDSDSAYAKLLQTGEAIGFAVYTLANLLHRKMTFYAEIEIEPSRHLLSGLSKKEAILSALMGLKAERAESGKPARLIVRADSAIDVEEANAYREDGVAGISISNPKEAKSIADRCIDLSLPYMADVSALGIRQALSLSPHRLYGASPLFKDRNSLLLSRYASCQIELPVGPLGELEKGMLGNLLLATPSLSSDPIAQYRQIKNDLGLDSDSWREFIIQSADGCFLDEEEKKFLKEIVIKKFLNGEE